MGGDKPVSKPGRLHRLRTDPGGLAVGAGLLFAFVLFFGLMFLMTRLTTFLWISHAYGRDAYEDGLRMVDKRTLSNGDRVPRSAQLAMGLGAFIPVAPVALLYWRWYRRWANQSYDRYNRA